MPEAHFITQVQVPCGILSSNSILREYLSGSIRIDPFNRSQLNPVSYDLTLGDEVRVYDFGFWGNLPLIGKYFQVLDSKKHNKTKAFRVGPEGLKLRPGIGYLMHTRERVFTESFVPIIDGKSSIARLFTIVHFTAGFGDPGFDGQYTLEVMVTHPVIVYPGQRICQIRFQSIYGEVTPYKGHYHGDTARGAVESHSYEQFETSLPYHCETVL